MFHFSTQQQASIACTGFFVSLLSYVFFWMVDLVRPGFVARFFSVHIFLLGVIVFGVWWGAVIEEYSDRPRIQQIMAMVFGFLFAIITWNLGSAFGGWRLIVSAVVFFVPLLVLRLIRYK
jgi:hypothetical protein